MKCRKCARFSKRLNSKNPICGACGYFGVLSVDFDLNRARPVKTKRRRCRDCSSILGADRYFHCHDCRPPSLQPSEDEFDTFSAFERLIEMEPLTTRSLTMRERIEAGAREAVSKNVR